MVRKEFEKRIEWIVPASADEPGARDTILAFSSIPSEKVSEYIVRRYLPPRQVDRWSERKEEYSTSMRRRTPMYFQELRDLDGVKILEKHLLPIEAAYISWRDSANQVVDFEDAFPGHPELLVLADQNPRREPVPTVLQALSKAIKRDEAYDIAEDFGWVDGGCWMLADAVSGLLPGSQVVGVVSRVGGGLEHVAVYWNGWYFDGTGAKRPAAFKRYWTDDEVDGLGPIDIRPMLAGHSFGGLVRYHSRAMRLQNYLRSHLTDQNPSRYETAVERFLQGKSYGASERLSSRGDRLYSFNTVIAQRLPSGRVFLNGTYYSPTTAHHVGLVRSKVKPDLVVFGAGYGVQDLEPLLSKRRLIATSDGPEGRVNVVMVTSQSQYGGKDWREYFLEIRNQNGIRYWALKSTDKGVPRKAYIEYLDSDNQLVPFAEAFPDHPELLVMKHRNPYVGKRRFHLPAVMWHRPGTRLLAVSYVQTARGILEVDLYRTEKGKYFRQQGLRIGVNAPWWWNYISRTQAILDWRDADQKHSTYAEAFE